MDIHKPKPWHGLREFLREYVIIVVGVLTALAGEQGVEWLRWRADVNEARTAIRAEVAYSMSSLLARTALSPCVERRAADLESWLQGNGTSVPRRPIGQPIFYGTRRQAWDTFNSTPAALHMPAREREATALVYGDFDNIRIIENADGTAWLDLADFEGAPTLDAGARMRLRGLVTRIRRADEAAQFLIAQTLKDARAIGVAPPRAAPIATSLGGRDMTDGLCEPLFG